MVSMLLAGCGFFASNPRPDDPNAVKPDPPAAATRWSSLHWQSVTFDDPDNASLEQEDWPEALAEGPGGFVAVGSNHDTTGYVGRIWHSADALDWQLVDSPELDALELTDVVASDEAFLAIGHRAANPNAPVTSILTSTDGTTWNEAETIEDAWAIDIASGPNGFAILLEVGETSDVLTSPDGASWMRVAGADIAPNLYLPNIAWAGDGWVAAGTSGNRAVLFRSADGLTWVEERLPASEPIDGIWRVSAYRVLPGRWATLVLGIDSAPSCEEDDDWCPKFQGAWSHTAATGWARLPRSNWLFDRGYGVDVHLAGDAGFLYMLGEDARISSDGWDWTDVESAEDAQLTREVLVSGRRVIAAGWQIGDAPALDAWFGTATIELEAD